LFIASLGVVAAPAGANGGVTGSVTPTTVAAGSTVTVTFQSSGATGVCDDQGPDFSEPTSSYEGKPLVFGLFPASVALDPQAKVPTAWFVDGTDLATLGFITDAGVLAPYSTDDEPIGWQGSFTGQVTLPSTLPGGTYNAVWGCGYPDSDGYDVGAPALVQPVTVTGGPNPGPGPAPAPADGISLTLDFKVGDNIRAGNAGVPVAGSGLQPAADYTVVLRSDPVQIGNGVNDANGAFSATFPVPGNTPGGPHSVTVTSLNSSGQPVSAVAWFTLDDNGTVTAISYDGPTPPAPVVATPSFTG
jgi:hypothetical protein